MPTAPELSGVLSINVYFQTSPLEMPPQEVRGGPWGSSLPMEGVVLGMESETGAQFWFCYGPSSFTAEIRAQESSGNEGKQQSAHRRA